jgi:hypothetical protein
MPQPRNRTVANVHVSTPFAQQYPKLIVDYTRRGHAWTQFPSNTWLKFPQVLLAKATNKQSYKDKVQGYCSYISTSQQKTPKGLVYIDQWGSLRMAANAAFICASVITHY